jgi:hypothetical protein
MEKPNFYGSEVDPSIPSFHYSEVEREEMRSKGMTDQEIQDKEDIVNNKLAQKKLEDEQKGK